MVQPCGLAKCFIVRAKFGFVYSKMLNFGYLKLFCSLVNLFAQKSVKRNVNCKKNNFRKCVVDQKSFSMIIKKRNLSTKIDKVIYMDVFHNAHRKTPFCHFSFVALLRNSFIQLTFEKHFL